MNDTLIIAQKETWGKLNEASERLKVEKGLKVWESLGNSNEGKKISFNLVRQVLVPKRRNRIKKALILSRFFGYRNNKGENYVRFF